MSNVLIVDDEESICWGLRRLLSEDGHQVAIASSAEDAFVSIKRTKPDLVVLDIRLPGMDGLTAMGRIKQLAGPVPIVIITAFGNLNYAVTAMRNGAWDYLAKPFNVEQAQAVFRRALGDKPAPGKPLPARLDTTPSDPLLGTSRAMQEVFKRIALVAPTDAPVLIVGESGTGKELVSRAIHAHSPRAKGPLIPVHLAALSPNLVESELFGHVRGAFTDAATSRQGLLELANGGTVLFDEASDIPLAVQTKLLRVLEQHEVTPVGDTQPRPTSFRAIVATNRDLRRECAERRFRQDLYFRLAVFEIRLPPLRERTDDIPLLAERFLANIRESAGATTLTDEAVRELCQRPWPGNVRELRNAVEHGALLARGGPIRPEHLPPVVDLSNFTPGQHAALTTGETALRQSVEQWARDRLATTGTAADLYQKFLDDVEPPLFDAVLRHTGHNRAAAADLLGIHRATLRKKLGGPHNEGS